MPVRIVVREDGTLEAALRRLDHVMYREVARRWHHRRYGYHEKPSALRRKRRKMRALGRRRWPPVLRIDLPAMLARTGPTNAAGS
jgi:ribosomal protein S21